jgi:hypothetical protein
MSPRIYGPATRGWDLEHHDKHEVKNTGRELLRTLNVYVPPAYTESGDERPPAKP